MDNQNTIKPLAPFSSTYSPNLPELLQQLRCSLAITTYQAGKVLFVGAKNAANLSMLPRTFHKAMGLALKGDRMAIATKSEVIVLENSPPLAQSYPPKAQYIRCALFASCYLLYRAGRYSRAALG